MEDDRRNFGIKQSEFGFAGENVKKEESFGFDSQLVRLNEDVIPPSRADPVAPTNMPMGMPTPQYPQDNMENVSSIDSELDDFFGGGQESPFGPNIIDLTSSPFGGEEDMSYIPDDMGESTWNMADTLERFGPQLDGYITSIFNFVTNIIEDVGGLPKREKLAVDDVARSNLSHNLIEYINYVDPRVTASPLILVAGSFGALMFTYIMKPVTAPGKKKVKKPKAEPKELSYEDEERIKGAFDGEW